jgi:hypothetical protein
MQKVFFAPSTSGVVIATVLAITASFVGFSMWKQSQTLPIISEGFGGVAVGSGNPDCLRTSAEAATIADFFIGRESQVEDGADNLKELTLILSKLACFKKDLMSVSGVVESTRYQPFATNHDLEPVAETTARCFAKTVPPRDLDLSFDKWSARGNDLLRRLCTAYKVSPTELAMLKKTFGILIADVKDVATKVCFVGEAIINGKTQGRTTAGYEPPGLIDLGPYKGRY